ncbi:MAG: TonB-dependent receptor, partial [Candidatus Solibacter sp.]
YYRKDGRWNANTFANNRDGKPRGESFVKQLGMQVGGPVYLPKVYNGRNRTFFMWAYENSNDNVAASSTFTVPAPEFSQGDFSRLVDSLGRKITIYDPTTGRDVGGKWVRDAFPGNQIPQNRLNPVAVKIMSYFPAPNYVTPNSAYASNNFNVAAGVNNPTNRFYNLAAKIDQNFGSKSRIFARFAANSRQEHKQTTAVIDRPGTSEAQTSRVNHAYVLDWVRTVSPTLILNTNFSYNRFLSTSRGDENHPFDPSTLGFPKSLTSQLPFPDDFGIYAIGGQQQLGWDDRLSLANNFTTHPNLTWIQGQHKLHAGVDIRLNQYTILDHGSNLRLTSSNGFTQADYLQGDNLSGNGVASWVLGNISGGASEWRAHPYISNHYYAPYVQDDWKLTRRLTVTLGLRYDISQPSVERNNHINNTFDTSRLNSVDKLIDRSQFPNVPPLRGGLTFATGDDRRGAPTYWGAIQPRIGVAYQVKPSVVFRGGWGRYFMNLGNLFQTQGYSYSNSAISSNDNGRTAAPNSLINPFPNGLLQPYGSSLGDLTFLGSGVSWTNRDARSGHMDEFSAGFQFKLPLESMLDLSYVGTRGNEVGASRNRNGSDSYTLAERQSCNWYEGGRVQNCSDTVANPFRGLAPFLGTSLYTSNTITKADLLLQDFPAFGSLSERSNDTRSWYNALQMTYETRKQNSVNVLFTLTYAKNIVDTGWDDIQRGLRRKQIDTATSPLRATLGLIYELPMGKGKRFLRGSNGIVSRLAGGWQIGAIGQWSKAGFLSLPGNTIMIGDPLAGYQLDWGAERSQGWNQCTAKMNNDGSITMQPNAIAAKCASYNWLMLPTGNGVSNPANLLSTVTTKIRNYSYPMLDASLTKITRINERFKLHFHADAYNLPNSVGRGGLSVGSPDGNNFGLLFKRDSGGTPRSLQLALKLLF